MKLSLIVKMRLMLQYTFKNPFTYFHTLKPCRILLLTCGVTFFFYTKSQYTVLYHFVVINQLLPFCFTIALYGAL